MQKNNMKIWDAVCKTDKANTKDVSYGKRKFTAIDAYSQIEKATKLWGAIGTGWKVEQSIIRETDSELVMLIAVLYLVDDNAIWSDPVYGYGCVSINPSKTNHAQNDSHKKAYTDGLTKALSFLGFDYDVFSGKFDDKYTNESKNNTAGDSKREEAPAGSGTGNGKSGNMMTPEQRKKIFALVGEKEWTAAGVKFHLQGKHRIESTKELTKKQASEFIEHLIADEGERDGQAKTQTKNESKGESEDPRNKELPF